MLFSVVAEFMYADQRPVWTSSLLYVLTKAGFTTQAARQAVVRASAAGWIAGERRGREARWQLTAEARRMFEVGTERVYAFSAEREPWDGRWLFLIVSIPDAKRGVRKRLYSSLRWAGLGNPAPGLWLTPHVDRSAEVGRVIDDFGLGDVSVSMVGAPGRIGLSVEEIVARAWDLEQAAASYEDLLRRFGTLAPEEGDEVLLALLELTDALRRFPFVDPQLPVELDATWIGRRAMAQLRALHDAWSGAAHARWLEIVETTGPRSRR